MHGAEHGNNADGAEEIGRVNEDLLARVVAYPQRSIRPKT
jgi:hypothetical protein